MWIFSCGYFRDQLVDWSLSVILKTPAARKESSMSRFLTFEDRLTIEKGLRENLSFGAIAKEWGRTELT